MSFGEAARDYAEGPNNLTNLYVERNEGIWTSVDDSPRHSIARLIREAETHKEAWYIEGLWQPNTVMVVHSLEGCFKSILAFQIGEALATGEPLMRKWKVPSALRVGVLQTEMPDNMVGERLRPMYPQGRIPQKLVVSDDALNMTIRGAFCPDEKFQVIHNWMTAEKIDVLVWDTINNMLSSCGNPNSEEAAAFFYNRVALLPHRGAMVVRHDGKPSKDSAMREGNQRIRGSNLHAEVASVVMQMHRKDKRTNAATLEIGKLRHDVLPEPLECWFDATKMRLTFLPPPIASLEDRPKTREELNDELLLRFKVSTRVADEMTRGLSAKGFLNASQEGHQRVWTLNRAATAQPDTPEAEWLSLVIPGLEEVAEPQPHPPEICNVEP
jgi:hypothetical protein